MSEEYEELEVRDALGGALRVAGAVKNAESYDELAAAISQRYAAREDYDRAVELADTINDPYTRDRTLSEVAVKAAAAGQEEYAFELLASIEDVSHQDTGASSIAIAHAAAGEFDRAVEIADSMEDNSATLAEIASHCAARGEYERALSLVERLDFPLYAALALMRIAGSYIEAGQTSEASSLLSQALRQAAAIDTLDEKATTLSEIALKFSAAGQEEQAAQVLAQALAVAEHAETAYKEPALAQIAASHSRLGQYDAAVKITEKIEDVYQAAPTLITLAFIEHEDETRQSEAQQLLSDAYDLVREEAPDTQSEESQRNSLLALIVRRNAEFGRPEEAQKVAESLYAPDEKHRALASAASSLAEAGKYDDALALVKAIDDDGYKTGALLRISRAMLTAQPDDERGLGVLSEAVSLSEGLARPVDTVQALADAAVTYTEAGHTERAAQLMRDALLEIKSVKGEYGK
ncbi:MAG: hypothetical protein JO360_04380, partial [Acidobacteria bacterium]|nr:hypothetical protein [Acidobacteriota bacterium]